MSTYCLDNHNNRMSIRKITKKSLLLITVKSLRYFQAKVQTEEINKDCLYLNRDCSQNTRYTDSGISRLKEETFTF